MRTCVRCCAEVFRPTGRGKWPKWCPPCKRIHEAEQRARPERRAAARRRAREWQHANRERAQRQGRVGHLRREYGLTEQELDALMGRQGGACAICRVPEADAPGGRLCVDHDHDSGQVRGLLCRKCNTAIGLLADSHDLVLRAVAYLVRQEVPA